MFADPNSLLVMQELCMDMLCNVVVELGKERNFPKVETNESGFTGQESQKVKVLLSYTKNFNENYLFTFVLSRLLSSILLRS